MKKEDSYLLHRSVGDPALAIGGAARTREKIRDTISTYCQFFSALGSRSNRFSIPVLHLASHSGLGVDQRSISAGRASDHYVHLPESMFLCLAGGAVPMSARSSRLISLWHIDGTLYSHSTRARCGMLLECQKISFPFFTSCLGFLTLFTFYEHNSHPLSTRLSSPINHPLHTRAVPRQIRAANNLAVVVL
jgi:hypothetical protein